jgi:hypothetical protein
MMIRQLSLDILDEVLFVPRAIVAAPIGQFANRLALKLVEGEDDLDHFEGLVLSLNGEVPFTLTRHRGHDPNQTAVSLPVEIGTVRGFSAIIGHIADELKIDAKTIVWQQERDDPPRLYA